jgi:hypothetical protein
VLDGIIYGALIGLGFAMTENVLYFMRALQGGGLLGMALNFWGRVIMFGFGHAMFTGLTGYGVGLARETDNPALRWLAPVGGFLAGVFAHFIWNTGATFIPAFAGENVLVYLFLLLPIQTLFLGLPGIVVLLVIANMTWKREAKIIAEQLASEVAAGVITQEELAVAGNSRERRRRLISTLQGRGLQPWLALRRFYDLQAELAFRKYHASRGERLKAAQQSVSEDAYRQAIQAARARLQAIGVSTA